MPTRGPDKTIQTIMFTFQCKNKTIQTNKFTASSIMQRKIPEAKIPGVFEPLQKNMRHSCFIHDLFFQFRITFEKYAHREMKRVFFN